MKGRRVLIPLPITRSMHRKRNSYYLRAVILITVALFLFLQLNMFAFTDNHENVVSETGNDSVYAIMSMVPSDLHKFLTSKTRNQTLISNNNINSTGNQMVEYYHPPNITEIRRLIAKHNELQLVLNEYVFGPLQNDSVIIVVQVHTRILYLRHLIVSLAQARDISKVLLIFSHDYYDEDINDLVQTIDFCKVMQIFYPYSIQTHPNEFPGVDPNDCPRDLRKEQAIKRKCNNALYPDLYGHYREAKFTQTKHHWWWKVNRVFDQLEVTRNHTGLVLFLEEDHYVAEDFLYVLDMMQDRTKDICPHCNILSLGTYLKTFNYFTYNSKSKSKSLSYIQYASASLINAKHLLGYHKNVKSLQTSSNQQQQQQQLLPQQQKQQSPKSKMQQLSYSNRNTITNNDYLTNLYKRSNTAAIYAGDTNPLTPKVSHSNNGSTSTGHYPNYNLNNSKSNHSVSFRNGGDATTHKASTTTITTTTAAPTGIGVGNLNGSPAQQTWNYHVLPSLYSIYQKVELMPWISSKHNMGFAFNRSTWQNIRKCPKQFCNYDDYNWDWSLQHLSQQCLKQKLYAMVVKGPRVFHIGECGVHHKKKNCESNQVISKVQKVLYIARRSKQLFPRNLVKIGTFSVASLKKRSKLRKGNGGWGDHRDQQLCLNMSIDTR